MALKICYDALNFVWLQLVQGKSCRLYSKLYFSETPLRRVEHF